MSLVRTRSIRARIVLYGFAALTLQLAACGGAQPQHVRPGGTRNREFKPGKYEQPSQPVSEGSLWQDTSRGLFADFRAARIGDLVTVRIDETARASGDANTHLDHEYSEQLGMPGLFGLTTALQNAYPDLNPEELLKLMADVRFRGDGETKRQGVARGTIAVRVKQLLPNRDLFVEGYKVILINDEELHIYISGVIRPQDIEPDNSVRSALVADAEIEFSGRGTLTQNQQQGWLANLLSKIRPF